MTLPARIAMKSRGTVVGHTPARGVGKLVARHRAPSLSGYSLILGGFVTINNSTQTNKVPILGSIPLVGQAFRFKQVTRSRTNLAFIITPIAFEAANPERAVQVSEYDRAQLIAPKGGLNDPNLLGPVNVNQTDFHNAMSTGQYQESDKNPVNAQKQYKKRLPAQNPQTPSAKPDDP
jgi:Flp pilus assembly secretin CpaC